jgi:hypothetical protein
VWVARVVARVARTCTQCFMLHLFLLAVPAPAPSSEYVCTSLLIALLEEILEVGVYHRPKRQSSSLLVAGAASTPPHLWYPRTNSTSEAPVLATFTCTPVFGQFWILDKRDA